MDIWICFNPAANERFNSLYWISYELRVVLQLDKWSKNYISLQSIMFYNIGILLVQLITPVVQKQVISYTYYFQASHEF